MAAERLRKIKEEPLVDERIPHPYREFYRELRGIRNSLEEIKDLFARVLPIPPAVPPAAPPAPGVPKIIVKPPTIGAVEVAEESIKKLAELIIAKLVKLPNRIEKIEVDTSATTQISLRKKDEIKAAVVLGFEIEDVGGGFTYIIVRETFGKDPRTAITGDKFDIEFDDLLITGSGNTGTAKLWVWWRE